MTRRKRKTNTTALIVYIVLTALAACAVMLAPYYGKTWYDSCSEFLESLKPHTTTVTFAPLDLWTDCPEATPSEHAVTPTPTDTPRITAPPTSVTLDPIPLHLIVSGDTPPEELTEVEDYVYTQILEIAAELKLDGLSDERKALKIHDWLKRNIKYISKSDRSSIVNAAHYALSKKKCDCFAFYAIGKLMLNQAGIENHMIRRDTEGSDHWWSLIKIGGLRVAASRIGKLPNYD